MSVEIFTPKLFYDLRKPNFDLDAAERIQDQKALKEVADNFEAIFIENLLKQARSSKLSDTVFETNADDNFVQMFDQELAKTSSTSVDIGIAEALIRQMSPHDFGDSS